MSERGRDLFNRLQSADSVRALIGQTEDVHFDCKEWPSHDGDAQRVFAKAACGLTNAEGGVIIVGLSARSTTKDEPDVVESAVPVRDTTQVKSKILDLTGQLVEPGIEGLQVIEINDPPGSRSGFVIIYVPPSDDPPRRSRKDSKFYLRIGSGTYPMEYFQIEERFGRRPVAGLKLHLEPKGVSGLTYEPRVPGRWFVLGLKNTSRGIARFPGFRCKHTSALTIDSFGIDGSNGFGLPRRPSESPWETFRGGIDHVIYPGEVLPITKAYQRGTDRGADGLQLPTVMGPNGQSMRQWTFPAISFQCEISCEGMPIVAFEENIPEETVIWPY